MKLPNGYGSVYKLSGNRRNPWVACVTIGYNKETRNQERRVIGYFPNKPKALNALADYNQINARNPIASTNDFCSPPRLTGHSGKVSA